MPHASNQPTRREFLRWAAAVTGGAILAPSFTLRSGRAENLVQLGAGASLGGRRPFPDDNPWNTDITQAPVHPNSAAILATMGLDTGLHPDFGTVWQGAPIGIPYIVVGGYQPRRPVRFEYADESDPGPYPIPPDAPIEGGPASDGDRHS